MAAAAALQREIDEFREREAIHEREKDQLRAENEQVAGLDEEVHQLKKEQENQAIKGLAAKQKRSRTDHDLSHKAGAKTKGTTPFLYALTIGALIWNRAFAEIDSWAFKFAISKRQFFVDFFGTIIQGGKHTLVNVRQRWSVIEAPSQTKSGSSLMRRGLSDTAGGSSSLSFAGHLAEHEMLARALAEAQNIIIKGKKKTWKLIIIILASQPAASGICDITDPRKVYECIRDTYPDAHAKRGLGSAPSLQWSWDAAIKFVVKHDNVSKKVAEAIERERRDKGQPMRSCTSSSSSMRSWPSSPPPSQVAPTRSSRSSPSSKRYSPLIDGANKIINEDMIKAVFGDAFWHRLKANSRRLGLGVPDDVDIDAYNRGLIDAARPMRQEDLQKRPTTAELEAEVAKYGEVRVPQERAAAREESTGGRRAIVVYILYPMSL
ncbi:unnamed protein product [Vitrella brassicaformis CCMP3155]|uniref:Uncharacterized protein n=1 Tax=Vitrella brassicaformis (strain CCMP3155) TaxID=1169540 RepID=A0A0G4F1T6_VITBC|nr:unnamed protein product [Vitrella brassicaformis CCMP3155]|eukprot:CEM05707.1 unnamed protein product [Vitrella brassicaformis CCMP3155]